MINYIEHTGKPTKHIKGGRLYQITTKDGHKKVMKFVGIAATKTMLDNGGFFLNFLTRDKKIEQIWFKDIVGLYDFKIHKPKRNSK